MNTRTVRLLCSAVALLLLSALPVFAAKPSAVRIVRLSLAQGDVQIDRNSGDGWEQAINNMPVIGGARIYAGDNSRAEVELEDGSSIRLAGPAQITLSELAFAPNGSPVTHVQIDSGTVYVNARLNDRAEFQVTSATGEVFAITQPSHLRFKAGEQVASLSVMDGQVEVLKDNGSTKVNAGETYNYILGQPDSAVRQAAVPPNADDSWDQQREAYNDQNAAQNPNGPDVNAPNPNGPEAYGPDENAPGEADLNYYGQYQDIPGYGEAWQPNDVGPDWDPFDYGAWCDYPWGWTFVSGYPWGWYPFYYGSWFHVGGRGWWWRPGGPGHNPGFPHSPHAPGSGFHAQPQIAGATPRGFAAPHPPAHLSHGSVAIAGSNLHVGPITQSHAAMVEETHSLARPGVPSSGPPASRSGAAFAPTHAAPSAGPRGAATVDRNAPFITGEKGTYRVSNPTAGGRSVYNAQHPPSFASRPGNYSPGRTYASNGGSHPYAYTGAASRYSTPEPAIPHGSMAPSSAPHFSGGGESFHGGGGAAVHSGGFSGGGGGFHGGGGGGGGHR